MRDAFRGYYAPTDEELDQIWSNGLIVLDTNALLNLFRYSEGTRDDFVLVLNALHDRLWIPHQVALEFQSRRLDVIADQMKAFDDIDGAIKSATSGIVKAIQSFRLHPSIDRSATTQLLEDSMKMLSDSVGHSREDYKSRVVEGGTNERVYGDITALYENRVGNPYDVDSLKAIYEDGAVRYEARIPPGFEDRDKPEPNRYGDLVLWKQLLDEVGVSKRPAIFITDDGKEDWWRRVRGKTYGPRIELVDEYFSASGQRIHFYTPERFLDFAKKRLGLNVSEDSLTEVEKLSQERSRADVNELFAERALLQEERNEIVRLLAFQESGPGLSTHQAERRSGRLEDLYDARSRIEAQIARLHDAFSDIDDDSQILSILDNLTDLESQRDDVEERLKRETDRQTKYARGLRDYGSDIGRSAVHEAQLQAVENRILGIDAVIDRLR